MTLNMVSVSFALEHFHNEVAFILNSNEVVCYGGDFETDATPYLSADFKSMMVPLQAVDMIINSGKSEEDRIDCLFWDGETKTVTFVMPYGDSKGTAQFTCGSNKMLLNGVEVAMENGTCAEIKDGRLFIPLEAMGVILGADVEWKLGDMWGELYLPDYIVYNEKKSDSTLM